MTVSAEGSPLLGWDLAAWRLAEADPSLRSTVVGIIEVAGSIDRDSLLRRVERAVVRERVLRSRIVKENGSPELVELPDFDVRAVVTFLDAQESVQAIALDMAKQSFREPLPLWRLTVVHTTQSTFIIAALHHSISDGNGALVLAGHLLDESLDIPPSDNPHEPVNEASETPAPTPLQQAIIRTLDRALRDPQGLARDLTSMLKSMSSLIEIPVSTYAHSMRARSSEFRYSLFAISKHQVRAAISGKGVSQHDALVACVASAFWRYHSRQGQKIDRIRINVPVALDADSVAANKFVVARLEIDVEDASVGALMQRSNAALRAWRQQPALLIAQELVEASRLVPTQILAAAVKKSDATISTMRGLPRLGHVLGAPVLSIWPLVAPVGAAVSVTSMGVGTDIAMCVSIDTSAVTDESLWNACLAEAMSEAAGVSLTPTLF